MDPVQIGYKPQYLTPPNVDQHHPTFPQATGRLIRQGPGRRSPRRATSASAARSPNKTCPRRADRSPGWPSTSTGAAGPGEGRVWHPADLPQGLPHEPRGQELPKDRRRSRRRLPPGRRAVGLRQGRRDATRLPVCKIIRDPRPAERYRALRALRRTARHGTAP